MNKNVKLPPYHSHQSEHIVLNLAPVVLHHGPVYYHQHLDPVLPGLGRPVSSYLLDRSPVSVRSGSVWVRGDISLFSDAAWLTAV